MSKHPEIDLTRVRPISIADRASKVEVSSFARPAAPGRSFQEFLHSLPDILAGPAVGEIARTIVAARRNGRAVVVAMGGHVVKTGLAPVLIGLLERGMITCLAGNGAVAIHDLEVACSGGTSENVVDGLQSGTFGMAGETAALFNDAAQTARREGLGLGEALGALLADAGPAHADVSLLVSAHRLGIPFTVHVGLGTDIVHMHACADGAALGEASLRDFRILTHHMRGLADGGVLLNLGSAVVLPETLLKAIAVLRNLDGSAYSGMLGVNFDFVQQYRSNQQVVTRVEAIGGRGVSLTGHHEILIPLLAHAVCDAQERSG